MEKIKKVLDVVTIYVSIIVMSVMVLLVLWQIFARYVLNNPSSFSEILTRYLFVWLVIISATYVFGQKEHMCITFVKDKLNKKVKKIVDILIQVITMVFSVAVMTVGGCIITKMQMRQLDPTLKIPLGYVYSIIPICGIIITLYSLYHLYRDFINKFEKEGGTGEWM